MREKEKDIEQQEGSGSRHCVDNSGCSGIHVNGDALHVTVEETDAGVRGGEGGTR